MERNSLYLRKNHDNIKEAHTAIVTDFDDTHVWFNFDNSIGYKAERTWSLSSFHREWYLATPLMEVLV